MARTFTTTFVDVVGGREIGPTKTHIGHVVEQEHCQACGRTDASEIYGDDGYTDCCNERVVEGNSCDNGENDCYHS